MPRPNAFDYRVLRRPEVQDYIEVLYAPPADTVLNLDFQRGTMVEFTTAGNATITLPDPKLCGGKSFTLMILYGGTHTITWAVSNGGTLKWPSGTTPTATSTNGKYDIFTFMCDGVYWFGQTYGASY